MKKLIQILAIIFIANQLSFAQLTATMSQSNITCAGINNGSATVTASGGISPYTFDWSPNGFVGDGTNTYSSLMSGVFTVTITDSNLDYVIANVTITKPPALTVGGVIVSNPVCYGTSSGSINITVTGGITPYTYFWSNGTTNEDITNIPSGMYSVTVTDSNGCNVTSSAILNQPSALFSIISIINVSCFGTSSGSVDLTVSGGNPPYMYSWSDGSTNQDIFNLPAGAYCLTVIDSNGCNSNTCATITEPATALTVTTTSTNTSCAGFCDGQANAIVIGGTPPYVYIWATGSMSQTQTNLCSGWYGLTVGDANSCYTTTNTTIYDSQGIEYSNNITNATCLEANGSATINITNGVPPYYYWLLNDTTQVTSTLTNLSAGAYFVQVSDSIGCSKIDTILISNIGASEINIVSLQNVRCNGTSTGSVSIAASGGISPYTISWSHGLLNSLTADTLFAGNYIVTVADSVGCVAVQNIGITQPGTLFLYITKTDANCGSYGTATAHAFGGTQPYWYMWSDGEIGQTAQINPSYTYVVTVIDANNCQTTGTVSVNQYCKNLIKGKVFIDNNDDCVMDSTESGLSNIYLKLTPGNNYTNTNYLGEYTFMADSGTYNIEVISNVPPLYSLTCPSNPSTITVMLSQMGDTIDGNNFAFHYDSTEIDLRTYLSSNTARPGFNYTYYINYKYYGNDTINATLTLTYDSILTYSNSSPAEYYHSYPEIKWDLTLAPNAQGYVYAYFVVPTINNGGYIGRVLTSTSKIEPFNNDADTLNNVSVYNRTITGSYDPNEKEVFPVGYGASGAILPTDSVLTYTIHFQNTGTDTAFTVVVIDTLSSYVEPATVVSGASSHAYEFDMSGQGILKWTFNQILLVDSTTNEPASNGFVTYTVKQKANNPHGALIENKAEIFFDFNPNITTNTATNKVDYYLSIKINESSQTGDKLEIIPNPFNENATISVISNNGNKYEKLEIYNITGSKVKTYNPTAKSENFEIQKGDLNSGIYFIKIIGKNRNMLSGKMVVY